MSFFIAEVSSNHSRDIDRAIKFIDTAAEIGCDAESFNCLRSINFLRQKFLKDLKNIEIGNCGNYLLIFYQYFQIAV